MPKMKTHSGAKKRFKQRSSGKIARKQAMAGHLLTKKSSKRKSDLHMAAEVSHADMGRVRRMLAS